MMDKNGLLAARVELNRAKEKHFRLLGAREFDDIKTSWSDFLVSYNRVFTKLEQASKVGGSKGWFDSIKNERRTTPEYSYLLHARNVDEHGIAAIYETAAADLRIGLGGESLYIDHLTINHDIISGKVYGQDRPPSVSIRPARIELNAVRDRGVDYEVPINNSTDFGDKYSPVELAKIGIEFAERVITEAGSMDNCG